MKHREYYQLCTFQEPEHFQRTSLGLKKQIKGRSRHSLSVGVQVQTLALLGLLTEIFFFCFAKFLMGGTSSNPFISQAVFRLPFGASGFLHFSQFLAEENLTQWWALSMLDVPWRVSKMRFPAKIVWLLLWTVCVAEGRSFAFYFFLYCKTFANMLFMAVWKTWSRRCDFITVLWPSVWDTFDIVNNVKKYKQLIWMAYLIIHHNFI